MDNPTDYEALLEHHKAVDEQLLAYRAALVKVAESDWRGGAWCIAVACEALGREQPAPTLTGANEANLK
jgi:hypothetical protein